MPLFCHHGGAKAAVTTLRGSRTSCLSSLRGASVDFGIVGHLLSPTRVREKVPVPPPSAGNWTSPGITSGLSIQNTVPILPEVLTIGSERILVAKGW